MIVVIVVIAVVRASNGSSSSRLAVVVGNMRALILKRNPNPNQDAFFRFRPGCELRVEPPRPACIPAKQITRVPTKP